MRRRRLPLMIAGLRRSWRVIELMIASTRLSSAVGRRHVHALAQLASCRESSPAARRSGPILRTARSWSRKSSRVNSFRRSLLLERLRLLVVDGLLGPLDQASARRPCRGSASPSGRGGTARGRRASRRCRRTGSARRSRPAPTARRRRARRRRAWSGRRRRSRRASWKALATSTASWPVIASTTSSSWCGCTAALIRSSSAISSASIVQAAGGVDDHHVAAEAARRLDAVAATATASRRRPSRCTGHARSAAPSTASCSMAAGRWTSQATSIGARALLAEVARQLGAAGRLAGALQAGHQDDRRAAWTRAAGRRWPRPSAS